MNTAYKGGVDQGANGKTYSNPYETASLQYIAFYRGYQEGAKLQGVTASAA